MIANAIMLWSFPIYGAGLLSGCCVALGCAGVVGCVGVLG
jgi:hypothetical protein